MHRGHRTLVHASAFLAVVGLVLMMGAAPTLADSRGGPPAKHGASSDQRHGQSPKGEARQKHAPSPKRAGAAPAQKEQSETNQAYGQVDEGPAASDPEPSPGRKGKAHGHDKPKEHPGPKADDRSPTEDGANVPAAVDEMVVPPPPAAPPRRATTAPRPAAVRALADGQGVTARVGSPLAPGAPSTVPPMPTVPAVVHHNGDDPTPSVEPLLGALAPAPALPFLPSLDNPAFPAVLLGALGLFLALFGRGDRRDPKLVEAVVDDQARDVDFS